MITHTRRALMRKAVLIELRVIGSFFVQKFAEVDVRWTPTLLMAFRQRCRTVNLWCG